MESDEASGVSFVVKALVVRASELDDVKSISCFGEASR
jgi:hypothetical protein